MKNKLLIGLGVFGVLLLGGYLGTAVYFNSHYLMNTTIAGIPCGAKTPNFVKEENSRSVAEYLLTVYDRENAKFHIRGMDISYAYVPSGEEEQILKKQNPFTWPLSLFQAQDFELSKSVSFDADALSRQLQGLAFFSEDYITKPENAYLSIAEDSFEVVPEILGNEPIFDNVYALVSEAVSNMEETVTLTDACYVKPEIFSDDPQIADTASQLEAYTNSTVTYEIDGADEGLTSSDILHMLTIDEDGVVTLDTSKVTAYVQRLASTYNTYGDVRTFKTSNGNKVKIGGGDYGWVINKSAEEQQLLADLGSGTPVTREPVYEQRAVQGGPDDIGDTYIEINYTDQHLWYYKNRKLVLDTDIVSGCLRTHNGSVDGVYKIVYKERDATLVGENYSSDVKYFMPFAYNIGIHDASWRSTFGGDIYKNSGSHGCINIPPAIAEKLFSKVETGTPVVAYYEEPVVLTNTAAQISNAYSYVKQND